MTSAFWRAFVEVLFVKVNTDQPQLVLDSPNIAFTIRPGVIRSTWVLGRSLQIEVLHFLFSVVVAELNRMGVLAIERGVDVAIQGLPIEGFVSFAVSTRFSPTNPIESLAINSVPTVSTQY